MISRLLDAPTSLEFQNVKVRLVSKEGHRYEYTAIRHLSAKRLNTQWLRMRILMCSQALFVTFKLSGTEADKQPVHLSSDNENPGNY